jgi:hypothetical protein
MYNSYESSIINWLSTERYTVASRHKNSKESLKLITRRSKSLGEHYMSKGKLVGSMIGAMAMAISRRQWSRLRPQLRPD